ncbi:hypothetical protein AXA44_05845 [Rhodococcus sp. SC4]|uniref:hypothetical protein n=1 Tax=Rhodococcus sp. LB1 TaxID=1807499 RepID=UPI000769ADC0|nr:hypothetical protein [Rhodococcus sp. LB1]KXF54132.1 hypothetical protein AXA44_05845 [Rhodococcus sp. SC4]KXX55195.1 hypothetical protein AZG88_20685 [Rhodococcus sp. LB1]
MRVSVRIAGADRGRNLVAVRGPRVPRGSAHDVLQSSQCAPSVAVGFLESPGGDYDTSCLDRVRVPTFTTP